MVKVSIPNVSDDADVIRERETFSRLQAELNELRADHEKLANGGPPPLTAFDREVNEALGLENPATAIPFDQEKAAERVRVLCAALERQARKVREAEILASQRIAESVKPDYTAIVRRGIRAIVALRQFVVDERAFREALSAADVRFADTLRPMGLQGFDETDCDSYLAEAKEYYSIAV